MEYILRNLKRISLILILLIAFVNKSSAQNIKITDSTRQFPIKYSLYFNVLGAEAGVQANIGNGFVGRLAVIPGVQFGYNAFTDPQYSWEINPSLYYEVAYYPWLKRRIKNQRNMDNFSGFYAAVSGVTVFNTIPMSIDGKNIVTPLIGLTPGYRSSIAKYGFFHFQYGAAVYHQEADQQLHIWPYGNFGLGFYFSR
ncbi:MAG: hypothetical protein EOP00_31145 [Pedobacter sp.]|nr:MAG: hypothetical protein EOP00_31145 [Pedobacter sp.]